ncbi:MAG TPA: ATP-binding cassette domain-containing protein [Bacillota bacterium]|nr:ATP-binding cassette domain-containing protein [Bacillota bacterium]
MTEHILETRDLEFNNVLSYGNLKIPRGKATFLVGESGRGKSTLLKLFNASLSPSRGELYYEGQKLEELDTIALRKEVLLISQNVFLFDTTIRENFRSFYEYREWELPSADRMEEFLRLCCLRLPLDRDCTTMSGGERQRVYMAIYLSFAPKVLMLDEPTSALDSRNGHDVLANILSYCREHAITPVVVSHDQELTREFAENIIQVGRRDK